MDRNVNNRASEVVPCPECAAPAGEECLGGEGSCEGRIRKAVASVDPDVAALAWEVGATATASIMAAWLVGDDEERQALEEFAAEEEIDWVQFIDWEGLE